MKKIYAFGLFVCLAICKRSNFVNILQMSLNLYMLFIYHVKLTVLKIIWMELSVRLEKYTKFFRYISAYQGRGEVFKVFATYLYCTKYNEIKCFIQLHKSMLRIKNHTKDFWYIIGYTLKRLDMYFKNCVMICFHHAKF